MALGTYPEETYSAVPVTVEVRVPENVTFRSVIGVVVAKDGVVVATSPDFVELRRDPGRTDLDGRRRRPSVAACGGPDATKALPDGDYVLYAVLPSRGACALSPGEPLVVCRERRGERWCGADVSVHPARATTGSDSRVRARRRLDRPPVTWSGTAEAGLLDERVVLVDAADRRIVGGLGRRAASGESVTSGTLTRGSVQGLPCARSPTSCDESAALPAGELPRVRGRDRGAVVGRGRDGSVDQRDRGRGADRDRHRPVGPARSGA